MAATILPALPKSIIKHIAVPVGAFLKSTGIIDYGREDCHAFKKKEELTSLTSHVQQFLTNNYNGAYAVSALNILTVRNVNKFIKDDHAKGRQTPESIAAEKVYNRLNNESKQRRRERRIEGAIAAASKKTERAAFLQDEAAKAEAILRRMIEWVHLLFDGELNVSEFPLVTVSNKAEGALVMKEGLVLLEEDEAGLRLLKTDVDSVFGILRGNASEESKECRQIVISLETLMEILRNCETVSHLFVNARPVISLPAAPTPILANRHRGTQPGSSKWKFGDPLTNKVGGIKVLSANMRQRMNGIQRKVKSFHGDMSLRISKEEDEIVQKKVQRKSVRFSVEKAKINSEYPTALNELKTVELSGYYQNAIIAPHLYTSTFRIKQNYIIVTISTKSNLV